MFPFHPRTSVLPFGSAGRMFVAVLNWVCSRCSAARVGGHHLQIRNPSERMVSATPLHRSPGCRQSWMRVPGTPGQCSERCHLSNPAGDPRHQPRGSTPSVGETRIVAPGSQWGANAHQVRFLPTTSQPTHLVLSLPPYHPNIILTDSYQFHSSRCAAAEAIPRKQAPSIITCAWPHSTHSHGWPGSVLVGRGKWGNSLGQCEKHRPGGTVISQGIRVGMIGGVRG